jgi:hypothetical protein
LAVVHHGAVSTAPPKKKTPQTTAELLNITKIIKKAPHRIIMTTAHGGEHRTAIILTTAHFGEHRTAIILTTAHSGEAPHRHILRMHAR